MLAKGVVPFDPALITQTVNYHGHNLLKQIVSENAAQIYTIKLQDIDYKVYQSRQVELRNLGGSRVKEIIEFISSKSDELLIAHPKLENVKNVEETNYEDRYKHQIPFEFFLKVDKNIRVDELLTTIEVGDIMYTEVLNNFENTAYTLLKPIAYDKGKHRFMSDLRPSDLKIILRNEDTVVTKADEDKIGRWMVGTRLRVEVLSIHLTGTVPTIFVSTKGVSLSPEAKEKFKLGKVLLKDLPQILSVSFDPSLKYLSDCIEKMDSYKNPQCIRQIADEMGLDLRSYPTLSSSVRKECQDKEKADTLRKAQMCKWAHKNVADGVAHFKQGQHEEAFQCLNKALQIDPENVEAFVAKGALLANLGRYEKAIEDFEKSLTLNPNHSNARKYMCETLVELGKQKEAKDLLKEAEKCYSRCLELNGSHDVARDALESVSEKLGPESNLMKMIKQENLKHNDEYLASLLKIEEMSKKKMEEEEKPIPIIGQSSKPSIDIDNKMLEDNPIPIITSKYNKYDDDEFLNDESSQMSSGVRPLSPLSQKLANEETLWPQPPPFAASAASFIGTMGPIQTPQDVSVPMSVFSNPPPNWPMPDITRPPPMPHLTTPVRAEMGSSYPEDPNYKARVEQFLKELDSRNQKKKVTSSSQESHRRSKQKEEKRSDKRRRSSSSSSNSSSKSRSSSSSSSSSSSCSSSSSRSSSGERKKVKQKKSSKKSKKNKSKKKKKAAKKKEKTKEKNPEDEVEVAVPEFDDLEEKLKAYYQKVKEMNSTQSSEISKAISKSKASSSKESKQNESLKKDKVNPLISKLSLSVHPAFLENDSDSEEEEKKRKSEMQKKFLTKIKADISDSSPISISEKVRKAAKALEKEIKASSLSSPSSVSSRSRSRSHSRSRRSRRSRSYSREKRGRSRSRGHRSRSRGRRSRSRGRRSRSRGYRSRSRSRSRSAERYHHKYDKYFRSRSRDKYSHRRRSHSRSPGRSYKPKPYKVQSYDSPFSYYSNKPIYKNKSSQDSNNGTAEKTLNIPLPKDDPKPTPVKFEIKKVDRAAHIVEEAKRKIQEHILSNDKIRSNNTNMKKGNLDTSQRFGKWASETEDKNSNKSRIDIFKEEGNDKAETEDKCSFRKPNLE